MQGRSAYHDPDYRRRITLLLLGLVVGLLPAPARAQRVSPRQETPPTGFHAPMANSPLLFSDWVKASISSQNPLFANDSNFVYNFDKTSQKLLATSDRQMQYKVNNREFQSITFYYSGDNILILEHVPAINEKDVFFRIMRSDDKYSLYYSLHSEVRGRSYVDTREYYIVFPFPDIHTARLRIMDKRLIKKAFALSTDQQKVETFLAQHADEEPSEYFLKELVLYLDQ
jgi:hypothetical protein